MTTLKVKINNTAELEENLPKLRRSLSVQKGIELKEGEDGIFLLIINDPVELNTLKHVSRILSSYNFGFYYPEEEREEEIEEIEEMKLKVRRRPQNREELQKLVHDLVELLNDAKRKVR
jgi:hypothetical protein